MGNKRGKYTRRIPDDERIAGLEHVAQMRERLIGDYKGAERCRAKIAAIKEGRDPSLLDEKPIW